MSLVKV